MSTKKKVPQYCALGAGIVGLIVLILGIVLGWVVIPDIIEDRVKDETRLDPESDTWEKWTDLPVPIQLSVYFFNITNYEKFVGSDNWSLTPEVKEVGPYVWKETRTKYAIRDGPDDTVFYRQNITYSFDEKKSGEGLKEDDTLTLLNVPLITALTLLDVNPIVRPLAETVLRSLLSSGESLFSPNFVVKDVMFKGSKLPPIYGSVELVARLLGIPLPDEFLNGEFAFYRAKNDTNAEGEWQVYRGNDDSSMFSIIKSINNGKTSLEPWWDGPCAMINGTDGTMFPPFIKTNTRLYIYVTEICRSIYMEFDSEVKFEGIPGYRFKLPERMFQGPHLNPDNECFCMPVKDPLNKTCDFVGLGRLFSCKANVPITIGKPHFLDADEWVVLEAQRMGLNPVRDLHDTYVDIEPNTGFPLRVHKRLQVGTEIQGFKTLDLPPFNTIPHTIYPVFWADENAELNEELIDEIKEKLITPLNWVKIGKWTLVGVGSFLTVVGIVVFGYLKFKK